MEIGKYDLSKTQVAFIILAILFVVYVIFNELGKAAWRKKLNAAINGIDLRISSGRASASELVDLTLQRKAILEQYLKSL